MNNIGTNIKVYKDLLGLLLGPVREKPGMYIGEAKISNLPNFIIGYNMAIQMSTDTTISSDRYFQPGFLEWFYHRYHIKPASFWETAFLEEAKNDEEKALELFFEYLEEYSISIEKESSAQK